MSKYYQIVIVGGGTAGITVASRLLRKNQSLKGKIAIIDPAEYHY
ncbi:FAD/NAD(P)-binding protein, partial [Staphylococcus epidermidis]